MSPDTIDRLVQEALLDLEAFFEDRLFPDGRADYPVWQAARYSLLGGGKRIRPQLLFRTGLLFGGDLPPASLPLAAALEMIHTYSLIHDDLPAMDDDDFRRGRPSCHKVYGEGVAILAGDLLLNGAYEVILSAYEQDPQFEIFQAMAELAFAAGGHGMILGQDRDLAMEIEAFDQVSMTEVKSMAMLKTSRLIRAALRMGGHLAKAPAKALFLLSRMGDSLGLAFQIRDDILDCISSRDKLGKTPNKDAAAGKKTFVTLAGLEGARVALKDEIAIMESTIDQLEEMGYDVAPLADYAHLLIERKY